MRKNWNGFVAASTLIAGLAVVTALYAQDQPATRQSPMGQGGMMMQDGQSMMNMMGQMSEMMDTCNKMMKEHMAKRDSERPKEQRQDREPHQQDNKG